jgi:hypothetical protein
MTASTNLYSITAPFSTSTPTLVSSDSFLIIEILLCRGDGSTFIISRMVSGISSIHIFKYSGSSEFIVSVAEGLISYEDIKINYDASRILIRLVSSV